MNTSPNTRAAALDKLADLSGDIFPAFVQVLRDAARALRAGERPPADLQHRITEAGVPAELSATALRLLAPEGEDGYPNPKVNAVLAHVGDFTALDFLDLALAALDQSCLRSATFNRAYAAVEAVVAEERPEDDGDQPSEADRRTGFNGA